jgi:hypothetical protein
MGKIGDNLPRWCINQGAFTRLVIRRAWVQFQPGNGAEPSGGVKELFSSN